MNLHVIASGSKGNASILYNEDTTILIDFGVSKIRLKEGLKEINKSIDDIDFVFVTHDHIDHIKNINTIDLDKVYSIKGNVKISKNNELKYFKEYKFKDFLVTPLLTSHDATSPCGFLFKDNKEELVYITDTGYLPSETLKMISNKEYYYFESNHDIEMLFNSGRPEILIDRIFGDEGHLSNVQASEYLSLIVGSKTKKIIFAHLSEDCNTEEKCIKTFENTFKLEGINLKKIEYKCAKQWSSIDL